MERYQFVPAQQSEYFLVQVLISNYVVFNSSLKGVPNLNNIYLETDKPVYRLGETSLCCSLSEFDALFLSISNYVLFKKFHAQCTYHVYIHEKNCTKNKYSIFFSSPPSVAADDRRQDSQHARGIRTQG